MYSWRATAKTARLSGASDEAQVTGPAKRIIARFINTIRSRWHGSLNYRIAYSLIFVTFLVALVFGTIAVTTIFLSVRAKETATLQNRLELNSSKLEIFLNEVMSHVKNLAQNTIVLNALVDTYDRDSYLVPFFREHRITEIVKHRLSLCDFQGTVLASNTGTSGAYHDKDLLDELIDKNRAVAKIVKSVKKTGSGHLLICYPVLYRATGTSEGFLVFETALQDVMKTLGGDERVSFSIFRKQALVARAEEISNQVFLHRKLDLQGPLRSLELALEVRTRAGHGILRICGALILLTALMIWLAIRISYSISNQLTRRIVQLSEAAHSIAGSGAPDSKVPVSGSDEIGHLAGAFNKMVDRLRASYDELEGRVEERTLLLADTNRNLTAEIEQRFAAEARLRESEQKYRELVENANSAILTMDVNGAVTFFNKYAEQFFGFSQREIINRNVVGTIVPAIESSGRDLASLIKEICADPERFRDHENENITKDGRRVWVRWMNKAMLDAACRPAGILSVGNDITERKHAEEALRKSGERLSKAQKMAHVGNWEWDLVTNELYWSEEVYHIYGVDPAHYTPTFETVGKAMHPGDLKTFLQAVHEAIYDRKPFDMHYRLIRPDGAVITVHTIGEVTYDPEGKPLVKSGTVQDVTARKKDEDALLLFRNLLDRSNDAIFVNDPETGRFLNVNEKACSSLGYDRERLLGLTTLDIEARFSNRAAWDDHVSEVKRKGHLILEGQNKRRDGTLFPVEVNVTYLTSGGQDYMVAVSRDITERKKLLEQLEHLNRRLAERAWEEITKNRTKEQLLQLQSRQAAMGEMIDNIAHQWRQPLNNLGLVLQGIEKKFTSGSLTCKRMQEQAKTGMSLIRYMSQTINDFTNFFRHDKAMVNFRVKDVVTTALSFMETSLKRNAIAVMVDIADEVTIKGYRNEYTQVLVNILNNARDVFVERAIENPAITLRAFRENGWSILTIADNGGGISSELLGKIFTPYFTTKQHNRGTGIGLYMAKTIIENNVNGKLTVRNKQEGAEFRIEVRDGK
jgi:PAS domain S-box-containing protein